jgi:putative tryptophan/tyrosine transport system substrate-binding protein
MRRRDFATVLGGSAALPLAARAQQLAMPVIGFLNSTSPGPWARYVDAFRSGLKSQGFVEGENVTIEFRSAEGNYDRLPAMAADLVRRKVAVLVSTGGSPKGAECTVGQACTSAGGVTPSAGAILLCMGLRGGKCFGRSGSLSLH